MQGQFLHKVLAGLGVLLVATGGTAIALLLLNSHQVTQPKVLLPDVERDLMLWELIEDSEYELPTQAAGDAAACIVFEEDSYTAELDYDDSSDSAFWPVNLFRRIGPVPYRIAFSYRFANTCEYAVSFEADMHYFDRKGEPIWGGRTPFAEQAAAPGASYRHIQSGVTSAQVRNQARGMHPIIYDARKAR